MGSSPAETKCDPRHTSHELPQKMGGANRHLYCGIAKKPFVNDKGRLLQ